MSGGTDHTRKAEPSDASAQTEALNVRGRYARRDAAGDAERYSLSDPYARAAWQERQIKVQALLAAAQFADWSALDVLDVGCGAGRNMQDWLQLGVQPERLQGIELLPERAATARSVLPEACRIWNADALDPALQQSIAPESQDLAVLFTVFSSILSPTVQQQLAQQVWRWVKPGGAVLWHDFIYNNPRNADVRGVTVTQLRALFPDAEMTVQRVTLAPPLGRIACRVSPALYPVLNSIPLLRTHVLCLLRKPLP